MSIFVLFTAFCAEHSPLFQNVPGARERRLEMDVARLLQGVPDSSPAWTPAALKGVCATALSRSSCLPFCQQSVQHENTYRDPIAKYCYGESPPELFPA